ncbi:MAG: hypothetical protein K2W96_25700 [Gemmataceae bacterium]|nr:hypothetical protein [Gemmataceae bacterium]
MSRRTGAALLASLLLAFAASGQDGDGKEKPKDKKEPPAGVKVGANLPATINPYNVTARVVPLVEPDKEGGGAAKPVAASTKGKFHSPITEYDLDPVVFLVARGLDDSAGFRDLLKKIDAAIGRNAAARLRCFVVFLLEDITDKEGKTVSADVVTFDRQRGELAGRLEKLADDLKLQGVVLTIAAPKDVAPFKLDGMAALNAVLYNRLKVEAVHDVGKDKLEKEDGAEAGAILKDIAGKLKAAK